MSSTPSPSAFTSSRSQRRPSHPRNAASTKTRPFKRHNPVLPFHKKIIRELADPQEDDLLVMAKGLGMRRVVCNLLKLYDGERNLILLVNATPNDESGLGEELSTMGVRRPGLRVIGFETDAKARREIYEGGGLLSVTSRILVVDMLTKNLPTELVTGLFVLHAERVSSTSLEAFIVRLYRQSNQNGFLKAFSDEPESFTFGIAPLQSTMKHLCLRRVQLWPRFHASVQESLGQRKADVIELYQPLSPMMIQIQAAVVECMEATLSELKRSNATLDLEDFTVDNALFRNFDRIVRSQLDPVWHRVGAKTKKLVGDLTQLRKLLTYLLSYDSVTFNSYLETIIASNSTSKGSAKQNQSPWLYLDAANVLFQTAKRRAYITRPHLTSRGRSISAPPSEITDVDEDEWAALDEAENVPPQTPTSAATPLFNGNSRNRTRSWPDGVEPVLEELPKWGLLSQVLEEIETEINMQPLMDLTAPGSQAVLVMCQSERTCTQLREYLSTMEPFTPGRESSDSVHAGRTMMERLLRTYFYWKHGLNDVSQSFKGGLKRDVERTGNDTASINGANGSAPNGYRRGGLPPNKRRRVRAGSTSASVNATNRQRTLMGENKEIMGEGDMEEEAGDIANFLRASQTPGPGPLGRASMTPDPSSTTRTPDVLDKQTLLLPSEQETVTDVFDDDAYDSYFGLIAPEETVIIRPYGGDDDDMVLQELRPRFVVMYDPDPAFVRRVEVYRSSNPGLGVRVYFMMYGDSVEEKKYLSGLRKEKDAFERLVREKGTMIIPLNGHPRAPHMMESAERRGSSTRNAGGGLSDVEPSRVIVDMREFRSTLPSLLHAHDVQVVPATLQVGDYVITPSMVVERKSVADLIQSFNSGRLYTQCEAMSVHYAQPILLIEFEEHKSFQLQTMVDQKAQPNNPATSTAAAARVGKDGIDPLTIQSKLVLLTLHFPRLRIIWSSSPWATVDIFKDLKLNHPEPDAGKAITIGGDDEDLGDSTGGGGGGLNQGLYNTGPQEMLRALPGVTSRNWKLVVSRVGSIQELTELDDEELQDVLGQEAAKEFKSFVSKDAR